LGEIKYLHDYASWLVYYTFILLVEILFGAYLKHSSFWPLANVKPISEDLVQAMPLLCMFALLIYYELYGQNLFYLYGFILLNLELQYLRLQIV